jgi:hypothetical protein
MLPWRWFRAARLPTRSRAAPGRVESIVLPHQYRHLSPLALGGDLRRVPEQTRRQVIEIKQTSDEMGAPS